VLKKRQRNPNMGGKIPTNIPQVVNQFNGCLAGRSEFHG